MVLRPVLLTQNLVRIVISVQNQSQFYFRADVETLKQLWATICDRLLRIRIRVRVSFVSVQVKSSQVYSKTGR